MSFLNICDADDIWDAMNNDVSIITRKSINLGKIPKAQFVGDLDTMPFIDWTLVDYKSYSVFGTSPNEIESTLAKNALELQIHTSRGCPFNCIFCVASTVHGKKMRYMSAKRVLENIKNMVETFGITHLSIVDDQFLIDTFRAKEILRGIVKNLPDLVVFFLNLTVTFIDEEMAELMKRVHCPRVVLAIESGSQYVLDNIMHKPVKVSNAHRAVAALKKNDLYVESFFVLGLPGETDEHRKETFDFVIDSGIDWAKFFVAAPFVGSELYRICIEKGYIDNVDGTSLNYFTSVINTPEYSGVYVTDAAYLMNLKANFIKNIYVRQGKYQLAIEKFTRIAKNYPPHAIAHYMLAKLYEKIGDVEQSLFNHEEYIRIIRSDAKWRFYADKLNLET